MVLKALFETEDGVQHALSRLREAGIDVQSVNEKSASEVKTEEQGLSGANIPALGLATLSMSNTGFAPMMNVGVLPGPMADGDETAYEHRSHETELEIQVSDLEAERAAGILRNAHGYQVKQY